jgi:ABC-type Mn2+/Zn2+ transport system permease subunit
MQPFEKFQFALGVLWSVVTLYFIITLFPPMQRRHEQWEAKIKGAGVKLTPPSWLQRLVMVLLISLMSANLLADAFHRNFAKMTGISSGAVCCLMMILPALYFSLGMLAKHLKNRQGPD